MALKALRTLKPPGRAERAEKAEMAERAVRARKVRSLSTVPTLLAHALPVHQRLENELPSWAELRHPNILPFYGAYSP